MVIRSALRWQHTAAAKVTDALIEAGATAEAAIMATACLESYEPALKAVPGGSLAELWLEAECLANVVRRVLREPSEHNAATARAMSAEASLLGADDLAANLLGLAGRAAGESDSPAVGSSEVCVAMPTAGPDQEERKCLPTST
jgi:hypothetical protein